MNCIKKIAYVCALLLMTTGAARGMDIFQAAATGNVTRIRELLAAHPAAASRRAFVNQQKRNEEPSEDCLTPLHFAATYGHLEAARLLIASGADINFQNSLSYSPLHHAIINGQAHIVTALMQAGADINLEGPCGNTPLHYAAAYGHENIVKTLIDATPVKYRHSFVNQQRGDDTTPLHEAAVYGHANVVQLLIKTGAHVNWQDDIKHTPLHWAVRQGRENVIHILMSAGADIELQDATGRSPLHWAAIGDKESIVKILIAAGANLNTRRNAYTRADKSSKDATALVEAAIEGREGIVKILIEAKAELPLTEYKLRWAPQIQNPEIKCLLLEYALKQAVKREAFTVAQALHQRLGANSPIAIAGPDVLRYVSELVLENYRLAEKYPQTPSQALVLEKQSEGLSCVVL